MRIISLQASNIKRLTAINITPEGNVIQITGKNGEGKSSVIDAIWMALGGKLIKEPIHKGAEKGSININLGRIIVKRSFTEKGSYLSVETADGAKYGSPQKMLDDLIGKMSFDPMEFMRLKDKEQFDVLAEYIGVDLSVIDTEFKSLYDDRRDKNRDLAAKKAEFESIVFIPDAPHEPVDLEALLTQMDEGRGANQSIEDAEATMDWAHSEADVIRNEIAETEPRLAALKDDLRDSLIFIDRCVSDFNEISKTKVDLSLIQEQIRNSQSVNRDVESNRAHKKLSEQVTEIQKAADTMTQALKDNRATRTLTIASAKMPIEGIGFGDGVVLYNDVPLEQASGAEKIRITVAIAMAMNPELRVIRIEDGSLLDSESMKIVDEMAKEHDYQFWIERVDESGKVGVLIEDGQVAAINGKKVDPIKTEEKKAPAPKKKARPKAAPKPAVSFDSAPYDPADDEHFEVEPETEEPAPVEQIKPEEF